jgi:LPXTG-motif cell wall-anchored protein
MKRGLPTALVVAALLNLWAAEAGPLAQQPAPTSTQTTDTSTTPAPPPTTPTTPAPPPPAPAAAKPQPKPIVIHAAKQHHEKQHAKKKKASKVKAAGDPGVTIKDFSFGPSSVTVHAGDTVTWTNAGPSPHTATGTGFDTGTLKKGQSGSHTFAQAGTFSYVCTIHPFMKGTVVVAASAGSSSAGKGASSGSSSSSTATPAAKSPGASTGGLPNTGVDVGSLIFSGVLMLGAGVLLRRRAA